MLAREALLGSQEPSSFIVRSGIDSKSLVSAACCSSSEGIFLCIGKTRSDKASYFPSSIKQLISRVRDAEGVGNLKVRYE